MTISARERALITRQCLRKRSYAKGEAWAQVRVAWYRRSVALRPYWCALCNGWHLTSRNASPPLSVPPEPAPAPSPSVDLSIGKGRARRIWLWIKRQGGSVVHLPPTDPERPDARLWRARLDRDGTRYEATALHKRDCMARFLWAHREALPDLERRVLSWNARQRAATHPPVETDDARS